ncbi:TPA: collagen-like triple helix repeat-containing protein [Burkholderia territorii]|uniref:collagen-like triple helix repeat-containing protein n=1 Tax=Burkholderia territorii TaxID=1503055 RepID=UPI0011CC755E|nr:collagen-like triple helix repeat-containing protein [Burkholderia territorii]TXG03079.1 collagen-like triple helix repeat-containing protein [Burkholderia territorii]HDR8861349.1 collagen-like triple helix repeat-containing protein [Burkholderia territorii]HDR8864909.1 collagen-like triple helix repeat-containing protein [Burkholderia territorii]HDR8871201.1 collagen-like triple helix repeat-containing protein [Burkholderia territorii]HDR8877796.1 collagen-like triple helix repeat-containi
MYRTRIVTSAALFAAAGTLAACGGTDVAAPASAAAASTSGTSVSGNTPGSNTSDGGWGTSGTPGTPGVVSTAGALAVGVGSTVSAMSLPVLGNTVTRSAGDAIASISTISRAAADALSDGLGKTGSTPNPVGTTVAGLGEVVGVTANPVEGLAQTIRALGSGPLAPLAPVTTPVGAALDTVAGGLGAAGNTLGATLASGAVQQVTQPLSSAVTPLVITAGQTTQQIGATTGLGQPVAGLLGQVGTALATTGSRMGSVSSQPAVGAVGAVVGALGNTVTNAGGLVNYNGPNGVAPIPGMIVSLAGASVATVQNGPSSGSSASGPLGGVLSGLGSTPLGSLTGALGGTTGAGAASPLAPVTNLVSTVTGTLGGAAGGGGSSANPLAPVTSLLGGVTGGVGK